MKYNKPFLTVLSIFFLFNACNDSTIPQVSINEVPKKFFNIQNGSQFTFVNANDTNKDLNYQSANYFNAFTNPDISNNEVLSYELNSSTEPISYLIRIEAGGSSTTPYNDRVSFIQKSNDTLSIGALMFYSNAQFIAPLETRDSVHFFNTRTIGNRQFQSVLRVKLFSNPKFNEVYFADGIGLVGYIRKNGSLVYLKKYTVLK